MGVLEARKDAEKVGYPIIGEERKEPSNVVDYDIHDEITKDTSSVINANNDTTTGMANVIPGINAPKLIASTSIIGGEGGGGAAGATLTSPNFSCSTDSAATIYRESKTFTISNEVGDLHFTQGVNGIIIPKTATYYLQVAYPKGLSMWQITTDIMQDNKIIHTYVGPQSSSGDQTDFFFIPLTKGKSLWSKYKITTTGNITGSRNIVINIQSIS